MPTTDDLAAQIAALSTRVDQIAEFVHFVPPKPPPPDPSVLYSDSFDGPTLKSTWTDAGKGTWSIQNGILLQSDLSQSDPRKLLASLLSVPADVQIVARVRVDSWTAGDMARAGVGLRTDAAGRGYCLCLRDGGIVRFLNDGSAWGNSLPFTWVPGSWYWMKLAVSGSTLKGKVWLDGNAEPADWMLTQTGWTTHSSGSVALVAGSGGVASSYDDVTVTALPALPPPPPPPPFTPPPTDPTRFNIVLDFTASPDLTPAQRQMFADAATRWQQIIVADKPDRMLNGVLVDDLVIGVQVVPIDGPGGIVGNSNWDAAGGSPTLPYHAVMRFDVADFGNLSPPIIEHEMGHALGFGTLWQFDGMISGYGTADPRFTGPKATAEYNRVFGTNEVGVPVENTGGAGTANVHWRESVFGGELMTGWFNGTAISSITVAALADMGYGVDMTQADPWTPGSVRMTGATKQHRCGTHE